MTVEKAKLRLYYQWMILLLGWVLVSFLFTGCGEMTKLQGDTIEKIEITIISPIEGNSSFTVEQPENVQIAADIANLLQNYKSAEVDTWFVDVTYAITNKDGSTQQMTYRNIRPYTDIFAPLFQTLEVREQREYILYTEIDQMKSAVITSPIKGSIILDSGKDKILLEQIVFSLKEFYHQESNTDNSLVYNNAKGLKISFHNASGNEAGSCLIYPADTKTNAILQQAGIAAQLIVRAEDIVSMVIHKDGKYVDIRDSALQELVLSSYYEGWSAMDSEISVEYVLKNTKGAHLDQYGSFFKGKIPFQIQALF